MIQRRETRKPLAPEDINQAIVERFYQHRAIRRIAEAFERDKQRKALLVMATGAGKTRTIVALADLLMRANWVKRVLFLADRKALVKQTVRAFTKHLPSAATVNLLEDRSREGRVYVSTYPTMMGLIDEVGAEERRFGVGLFRSRGDRRGTSLGLSEVQGHLRVFRQPPGRPHCDAERRS